MNTNAPLERFEFRCHSYTHVSRVHEVPRYSHHHFEHTDIAIVVILYHSRVKSFMQLGALMYVVSSFDARSAHATVQQASTGQISIAQRSVIRAELDDGDDMISLDHGSTAMEA
jgi:DNA-binding NarL/FixJ family response regulator